MGWETLAPYYNLENWDKTLIQGGSSEEWSKYNTREATLESKDDAATANLGISYHMPTFDELKELVTKCTFKFAYDYSHKGVIVTGPNGNSIFIPVYSYDGNNGDNTIYTIYGYYPSNQLTNTLRFVHGLRVSATYSSASYNVNIDRTGGFVIRPVYKEVPSINIGTGTTIPEDSQAKPNGFSRK